MSFSEYQTLLKDPVNKSEYSNGKKATLPVPHRRCCQCSQEQNRSLLRTPKGYKAHQDITLYSVMANIHNDNILHTQICSKTQY